MGVYYHVYIGPYIRCVNVKSETMMNGTRCPKCKIKSDANFCSRCGYRIESYSESIVDWVVDEEVLEEIFNNAGKDYYKELSKIQFFDLESEDDPMNYYFAHRKSTPGFEIDPKHEFGVITKEVDSTKEISVMKEMCEDTLALLRTAYGEDKVFVEWGVISYTS